MKDERSEGRIVWLDAARGIGILLIVAGHILPMTLPISHFIYSFHVPLFFFLSGMVLQTRSVCSQPFTRFVGKKAGSLLYPYAVFSVLSLACERVFDSLDRFGGSVPGTVLLLGDGPLWFLPALFIAEVLFYVIHSIDTEAGGCGGRRGHPSAANAGLCAWKREFHPAAGKGIRNRNWYLHAAVDAALLAVSTWLSGRFYFAVADPDVVSLWSIGNVLNRGIIGFLWMEAGWLLATIQERDGLQNRTRNALAVLAMIGSILLSGHNTYVDLHYSLLGNPLLYYISGALAVYAVTQLSRQLPGKISDALAFWGRNSLIVFATHVNLWMLVWAERILQRMDGVLQWLLTVILVLLVEAVLVVLINRFAGWLISARALRRALQDGRMRFYIPLAGGLSFLLAQYAKYLYMHASDLGQQGMASIQCLTRPGSIPADICLLLAIAVPVLAGRRLLHETEGEQTSVGNLAADKVSSASPKRTPLPDSGDGRTLNGCGRSGALLRILLGNAMWFVAIYKTVELFWSGYGCILTGGVIMLLLTAVQGRRIR